MPKAPPQTSALKVHEDRDEPHPEFEHMPLTDLGQLALAARREYFAAGGEPLSRDEIAWEVAERRGVDPTQAGPTRTGIPILPQAER